MDMMVENATEQTDRHVTSTLKTYWWEKALQYGLIVVTFFYLYAPVLSHLVFDWWDDPDYSHGFLIPLLSVYFVWERKEKLSTVRPQPSWWGLLLLMLGLCLLLLGNIGAELFTMRFSLVVVIAGLIWYLFGRRWLKILAFPLVFLLFMIPLPAIIMNGLTLPLQLLAAKMATWSLQLISLPVYREGNIIFLPHTTLEVVEACSGIRSLVSLTALAVVFSYMTQRTFWKQGMLVVSAVPIAMVVNAFRIWGTGVLAHLYGTQVAEGFYHDFAGWLVFVIAFGLLIMEGCILSQFAKKRRRVMEEMSS